MMADIAEAKRLIAASSIEGMRILGAGVSKPCYQGRYNAAAQAALEDPKAQLTPEERRLIASFIEPDEPEDRMGFTLRVRMSLAEKDRLERLAGEAGASMSEYARDRILG